MTATSARGTAAQERVSIAVLHPGEMGAAIGARLRERGHRVAWASLGRGAASHRRATESGLEDAGSLRETLAGCSIALSVCPPHGALELAREVAALGFAGRYVDANAVAPATAQQIGAIVQAGGASFVDGGIIGPPPAGRSGARLFLAGEGASELAPLLSSGTFAAIALDGPVGAASALKACYSAWNKGSIAMLAAIRALACSHGVDDALLDEWRGSDPDVIRRLERVPASARKAWRWSGEMDEIAAAFRQSGLPSGFHEAAAEAYRLLEGFKDAGASPSFEELVEALTTERTTEASRCDDFPRG